MSDQYVVEFMQKYWVYGLSWAMSSFWYINCHAARSKLIHFPFLACTMYNFYCKMMQMHLKREFMGEKRRHENSPNIKSPKLKKLESPLQAYGIESIALDNAVRLEWSKVTRNVRTFL